MGYNTESDIRERVMEHYEELLNLVPKERVVGIFLQGSQNYKLSTDSSDIDTKAVVAPSIKEIASNKKPMSTTHIMDNGEHLEIKDIRLLFNCFKNQGLNYIEILFTKYFVLNDDFKDIWSTLVDCREQIAHLSWVKSIKAMQGTARNKYNSMFRMTSEDDSHIGYNKKNLYQMFRMREMVDRYLRSEPYEKILVPINPKYFLDVKNGKYSRMEAGVISDILMEDTDSNCDDFCSRFSHVDINSEAVELLDKVQYDIVYRSLKMQIGE